MIKKNLSNIILIFLIQFIIYNISYAIKSHANKKNNKYTIIHKLNNSTFTRNLPNSIISFYKTGNGNFIPANKLFAEPIQLLILYELLKETIDTLTKYNVDYWLNRETLVYCQKFSCFAPWQNGTHLAINYDQLRSQIRNISTDLNKKGIIFNCFEHILNLHDDSYLIFDKHGFTNAIKKHDTSYKSIGINAKYANLENQTNPISICITPYKVTETNTYNLISTTQGSHNNKDATENFITSDIYPLNSTFLVDLTVKIANNVDKIINSYDYGKNFYRLSVGKQEHTYYKPIVIEDIRQYPDFNDILSDFLDFTFKNCLYNK